MSCSSRSSASSPPALKVKKRIPAKALSGKDSGQCVTEDFNPPLPSQDVSKYDQERIKAHLMYADITLRNQDRKLSHIGTQALNLI